MTDLRWRPAPLALALATCSTTALLVAVVTGAPQLVVFAAPLLGALLRVTWWPPGQAGVHAETTPNPLRCFESDVIDLEVTVVVAAGSVDVAADPKLSDGLELVECTVLPIEPGAGRRRLGLRLRAQRWGNHTVAVQVRVTGAGGLVRAEATVPACEVRVYPHVPAEAVAVSHAELSDRLGAHLTRRHGTGVEYADVRAYVPGDQLRTVNWPVSARRGLLHVTERFSDRAADLVVLVDTYAQAPGPASVATGRVARGATQVVQAALQRGDRVGLVVHGQKTRWLGPDIGRRQFYRVLDTVLDAGVAHAATGTLTPRQAVPPGATVVAFSTLLETDFALALIDLSRRGHLVVAVDVLAGSPFLAEPDPLVTAMWHLERRTMHHNLGVSGVAVVDWDGAAPLTHSLSGLDVAHHPRRRGRR